MHKCSLRKIAFENIICKMSAILFQLLPLYQFSFLWILQLLLQSNVIWELSKIILPKYTRPEITFMLKISIEESLWNVSEALSWHLKKSATPVQANNKENIKAPHYWPFVKGIYQSLANSTHKGPAMWKTFPCCDSIMNGRHISLFQEFNKRKHWENIFKPKLRVFIICRKCNCSCCQFFRNCN